MELSGSEVFVQVVPIDGATEIGWGTSVAERLSDRLPDFRAAVNAGALAVVATLNDLPSAAGWELDEVTASFGVTLAAEAGVLLTKATAGGTLDVTLTYCHRGRADS
jgi:hypothetical protein